MRIFATLSCNSVDAKIVW